MENLLFVPPQQATGSFSKLDYLCYHRALYFQSVMIMSRFDVVPCSATPHDVNFLMCLHLAMSSTKNLIVERIAPVLSDVLASSLEQFQ